MDFMSKRLTYLFEDAAEFARDNGTLQLFESLESTLLDFARLLQCTDTQSSGKRARGIEFMREGKILFVFYVERLRADLPGACVLSVDTDKFAPHLAVTLEKLIGHLESEMPVTVPKDGTYRFASVGFRTLEQSTHLFRELSRLMRFALSRYPARECFSPKATWVKGFDNWDVDHAVGAVQSPDSMPSVGAGADPGAELTESAEPAESAGSDVSVEPPSSADAEQDAKVAPGAGAHAPQSRNDETASSSDPESPPPGVDAMVWRQICERRGQQRFRKSLLVAYNHRCAITRCAVVAALEAAHLTPNCRQTNYEVTNGIMLRADIHTLFDLHLVSIDPDSMLVRLHPSLIESYESLDGEPIHMPAAAALQPDAARLRDHFERWQSLLESGTA